jgi:D-alanyl-D-alanine carboxypeptidase (penicillin-binding protein 5/6)
MTHSINHLLLGLALLLAVTSTSCTTKMQARRNIEADFSRPVYTPPPPASNPPEAEQSPWRFPERAPHIHASNFIMIDAGSGQTIAYKGPDQTRAVASTQKIVTALTVLEGGDLDAPITIRPEDCAVPPSKIYVKPGQTYSKRQMLNACLVKSGNDAAMVLGRDHSGSIPEFSAAMNRKAYQLGATHSHFVNPHGLTEPGQYSTARDMARIAYHAYRNPTIRSIVRQSSYTLNGPDGSKTLKNTNKLLTRMPEANGMKTGFTNAAGKCLISCASAGDQTVILVQLGSNSAHIWDDAETMMRWGLENAGRKSSFTTRVEDQISPSATTTRLAALN